MKIAVLGTGAFGIALASIFYNNKHDITMWTNSEKEKNELLQKRKSEKVNYTIPNDIIITTDMKEAIKNKSIIVMAVPAKYINDVSYELGKCYQKEQVICLASKGIIQNNTPFLYDIIKNNTKAEHIAIISGGTFAIDIINKDPVGLSLATRSLTAQKLIIQGMKNDYLKLRCTDDIIGTEICGAIKNIIAIASGMLAGMGLSESTSAMFITESLHDIKEFIKNLGGNEKTILSFAGFGDLLLTCTSTKSRNYILGKIIGEGKETNEINSYIRNTTVEGLDTLKAVKKLTDDKKICVPIINTIYNIVINKQNPKLLIEFLMQKE